jgi:aminopeptidase YwaD
MKHALLTVVLCAALSARGQDAGYARKSIEFLTSRKCFGRGYVNHGLARAQHFIEKEIRKSGARPLFGDNYSQTFIHPVNTFPSACGVSLNGMKLRPGYDFIPDPAASSLEGTFDLTRADSVTYITNDSLLRIVMKKKLTFSVSGSQENICTIEVLRAAIDTMTVRHALVRLTARIDRNFKSSNVGCMIPGTGSDSMIVFTAHYDHLGGIGNKTWFPGANDNACGVAMVLDLLRHYSAHPSRYAMVFIFFAGEEAGLLGSRYFVDHSPVPLGRIRFIVNLDLVGTGDDGIMVVNGAVYEHQFARLEQLNAQQNFVKQVRKRGKASNSDHYWFSERGVPAFFIYTMGGISAYHDVHDISRTLPLTEYNDLFRMLVQFVAE